jgi:nicotinate-nucleotide adenylyltransferase
MASIALFGGSFNPPHEGHFEMAKHILEELNVNKVRFLFSNNWQKDPKQYASTKHRMAMGKILAKNYPDLPFEMSDIQEKLGTHITYEVLKKLKEQEPEHNFIWVMGADNLADFHTWEHYEDIVNNFPIAVVDRLNYTKKAQDSFTALTFKHLQTHNPENLNNQNNGWCFLKAAPKINLSSSAILSELRSGKGSFSSEFNSVVSYIKKHNLYGLNKQAKLKPNKP